MHTSDNAIRTIDMQYDIARSTCWRDTYTVTNVTMAAQRAMTIIALRYCPLYIHVINIAFRFLTILVIAVNMLKTGGNLPCRGRRLLQCRTRKHQDETLPTRKRCLPTCGWATLASSKLSYSSLKKHDPFVKPSYALVLRRDQN